MSEYTKASIQQKETNFITFNLESSAIKESTCIEYRSPIFTFKENPKEECYLSFVSSKEKVPPQKVTCITLHFINKQGGQEENCTYQVASSILNRPEFGIYAFQSHRYGISELKHYKFFSVNELSKGVNKNGVIQLCFDVTRFLNSEITSVESTFEPQNNEKMLRLYCFAKNEEYTDVVLRVGDKEIKAHKNILASCSDVFDAMFKSKMQEEQTGVINVEQFKPEVIREMLYYMYTNNVQDLPKMSHELFEAAHFYNLHDLEILCKNFMISNVNVENVTTTSELADKYYLKDVQISVNKFIKNNEAQVMKNTEYLNYLLSRLSVKNVAKCLTLADKYKLKDFKTPLKEFVKDNIKEVIKDSKYRYLYNTNPTVILEIDEFIADQAQK